MAQCKRILPNGEQCSNRAVPGTDYCAQHRRIQFRPVVSLPSVPPPPDKERKKKRKEPEPPPEWVARPSAAGEEPAFPGLRADARNVLVAPQACIWLGGEGPVGQPVPLFDRLARLLAALSGELALPGHVTVRLAPQESGALVSLAPPRPDAVDLSRFYDAAAAAADLSGGLLYVGQKRAFIQYRDGAAPRGYDAGGVEPPPGDALYLVDRQGTHPVSPRSLKDALLDRLLLQIAPLPARGAQLPEVALALVAPPLYPMLARYFRAHHLRYRVARFHGAGGETYLLFELAPRADAPTGALLPAFVLSYLEGLSRAAVLVEVWAGAGRRVLVEWRRRYPCQPRHVAAAFPTDSLLLFTAGPDFANLCVSPAPAFFEGDDLTAAHVPRPQQTGLKPLSGRDKLSLDLPVRLRRDSGPTPSTAALILNAEEIGWVRRLLYRLPGEVFDAYTLCLDENTGRAVLVGEGAPVEGLPFGLPLRRVQDTPLFIPLHARFAPDLPWALLAKALEIQEGTYTFLTVEERLDVPRRGFVPLSRALVAEPGRPRVAFKVRPASTLPSLHWTPPPGPEQPEAPSRPDRSEQAELMRRMLEASPQPEAGLQPEITGAPETRERIVVRQVEPQDKGAWLQERAEACRREGDLWGAALCFALSGNAVEAGRCYRQGAQEIGREDKGQ